MEDLGDVLTHLDRVDTPALLGVAGRVKEAQRAIDVALVLVCVEWAARHAHDPFEGEDPTTAAARRRHQGPVLVRVGGPGTPRVQAWAHADLALSLEVSPWVARQRLAEALDLVYRLPKIWQITRTLGCAVWVVRRIATATRELPRSAAAVIDEEVAAVIGTESPGRVIGLVEARVAEHDQARHEHQATAAAQTHRVRFGRVEPDGTQTLYARMGIKDAVFLRATINHLAQILTPDHPDHTPGQLAAAALGLLGRPAEALTLLLGHHQTNHNRPGDDPAPEDDGPSSAFALRDDVLTALRRCDPTRLRPQAVFYVHAHTEVLSGLVAGVCRVEDYGPHTLNQTIGLLADLAVTVQPVIDLNIPAHTNAYEHPAVIKERVRLTQPGDYYPYASSRSVRGCEFDHPTPYQPNGPPAQTGTHNSGPLSRHHHRIKTHQPGWSATQLGPGRYLWNTPHGPHLVDHTGTHHLHPTNPTGTVEDLLSAQGQPTPGRRSGGGAVLRQHPARRSPEITSRPGRGGPPQSANNG